MNHNFWTHMPLVKAVNFDQSKVSVPQVKTRNCINVLEQEVTREEGWVHHARSLLAQDLDVNQNILWAAFHASCQLQPQNPPAIAALLPQFFEKSDNPAWYDHNQRKYILSESRSNFCFIL